MNPHPDAGHRAHKYPALIARWRRVARAAGATLRPLGPADGFTVYAVENRRRTRQAPANGGLYITAGIHGDEPGSTEGLILWAERHLAALTTTAANGQGGEPLPFFIVPCLNPWGLVNNRRESADGTDLNRVFDRAEHAPVGALKERLAGRWFDLALALHEDYDATGLYLYEISEARALDLGEALVAAARKARFPIDPRVIIEVRRALDRGLVRMRRRSSLAKFDIYPESIWLYLNGTRQALTIETPSEFSLAERARLQARLIEVCVERLLPRWKERASYGAAVTRTSGIGPASGK